MSQTTILIAEDFETFREFARNQLQRRAEFRVVSESDGSAAVETALELQPDYPQTHSSIGVLYAAGGDYRRAAAEFRKAAAADPDEPEWHYNLGLALANTEQLEEALSEFREAVSLKPDYAEARLQIEQEAPFSDLLVRSAA